MVVVPLLGVIVAYIRVMLKATDNEEKTKSLGTRVDTYANALAELRIHFADTYVKKDDLEKVEDRIGKRLDTVEHTIRNTSATILAALTSTGRVGRGGGQS